VLQRIKTRTIAELWSLLWP